jgi:DNA-binding transcriptional regulator YdaS (Cro superfamily)
MTLKDYFKNKPRGAKSEMADKLGITRTWMAQLISQSVVPSATLAVAIHQLTEGQVSRECLRPDLFGVVR